MKITHLLDDRRSDVEAILKDSGSGLSFETFRKGCEILFASHNFPDGQAITFLMQLAALGLDPQPKADQVYIATFSSKQPVYNVGIFYKGYLTLYARQGIRINSGAVREGDEFKIISGTNPEVIHAPDIMNPAPRPIIAAYAIATAPDGFKYLSFATRAEIDKAKAKGSYYMLAGEEAMCKKIAVLKLKHQIPIISTAVAEIEGFESTSYHAMPPAGDVQTLASLNDLYAEYELTSEIIDEIERTFEGDADAIRAHIATEYGQE